MIKKEEVKHSRFETSIELAKFRQQLQAMKNKTEQMKSLVSPTSINTPEYYKYSIFSDLLNKINSLIEHFNQFHVQSQKADELKAVKNLLLDILNQILKMNSTQILDIFTSRNSYKTISNNLTHFITVGTGVTAGFFLGGIPGAVAGYFGGIICMENSLSKKLPESALIYINFVHSLIHTLKDLTTYLKEEKCHSLLAFNLKHLHCSKTKVKDEDIKAGYIYVYPQTDEHNIAFKGEDNKIYRINYTNYLSEKEYRINNLTEQRAFSLCLLSLYHALYSPLVKNLQETLEDSVSMQHK